MYSVGSHQCIAYANLGSIHDVRRKQHSVQAETMIVSNMRKILDSFNTEYKERSDASTLKVQSKFNPQAYLARLKHVGRI